MGGNGGKSDAELLGAAQAGSRGALEALFARHADSLWRLAVLAAGRPDLAEDAVQDAFLRLLGRPEGAGADASARARLAGAVMTAAAHLSRSEARRRRREGRAAPARREPSPAESAERRELAAAAAAALAALAPDERLAVALCHREGFSLTETAAALGVPVSTAESRVRRGLETIRRRLAASGFGALAAPALPGALGLAGPAHAPAGLAGKLSALAATKTKLAASGAALKGGLAVKAFAGIVLAGVLAGGAAVLLAAGGGAGPAAAEPKLDPPFIITFWCAPPTREATVERYKEIADCGFNVVLLPADEKGDLESNRKMLEACAAAGLKAFVYDKRVYAREWKKQKIDPSSAEFGRTIDAVVADYSGHPALAGYYISDEPSPEDLPGIAAVAEHLRGKDPKHFAYVNLLPSYWDGFRRFARTDKKYYETHIATFVEKVHPAVVSWDHYQQMGPNKGPQYFSDLEDVRRVCLKSGVPYMQVILSSPHYGYRDPNEADLRWQVYTTLCYGARGISYFTYWPVLGEAIIGRNGKPRASYGWVRGINARVKALAPTLVKLKSAGVYHSEPLPKGTAKLAADAPVRKMEGGEMVLGWLRDEAGGDYLFVVNRSFKDKFKASLTLDPAVKKVEEISQETGQPTAAAFAAGVLSADLEAGEGRLFKLEK